MNRKMEALEVYVGDNGHVVLKQDNFGQDDSVIILSPHQVDAVVQWLKEAKNEALQSDASNPALNGTRLS